MKVLHVSESDIRGGAARAAYRLHRGLRDADVDSQMHVQWKHSDDSTVEGLDRKRDKLSARVRRFAEKKVLSWGKHSLVYQSLNVLPSTLGPRVLRDDADVVHLHWIGNDTLSISEIGRIRAPVVWTLHDMWPFRGVEHYDDDQLRRSLRENGAAAAPDEHIGAQTESPSVLPMIEAWVRRHKSHHWSAQNITFVATTPWMKREAQQSGVTNGARIERIGYGLDLDVYKPAPTNTARKLLNLPPDKPLILFGAVNPSTNPRKGFASLQSALRQVKDRTEDADLVVFGESRPDPPPDLPMDVHYLGHLHDDVSLVLAYSSADVMVVPSIQEAFGQTIIEAMACGVPVVAFDATGPGGVVRHEKTGYLAEAFDAAALAEGIRWVLGDADRRSRLATQCRQCVEDHYDIRDSARKYVALYRDLLQT